MPDFNQFTSYDYEDVSLPDVKSGCLKVFQSLGAFQGQIVVIGGLAPALIIDQSKEQKDPDPVKRHVGTRDVDIGLSLGIVEEQSYDHIVRRLRESGFQRDQNNQGNPTNHRWITNTGSHHIQIDFQIPADEQSPSPGRVQNLTPELSAIVTPGLHLAFQDARTKRLEGETPEGDRVSRDIQICGPASLITLKGLAIHERNKWKDYYDIFYVLRNWPDGFEDIAEKTIELHQYDEDNHVRSCIDHLGRDFDTDDHVGPRNVARFIMGEAIDDQPSEERDQLIRQSRLLVDRYCSIVESGLSCS